MFDKLDRTQIRAVCKFFGGIKSVADKAGVDDGNLSRWLRDKPTLSDEKVAAVMYSLGFVNGQPDASNVHIWRIKSVSFKNYASAFKAYFPDGARIAGAPWSQPGFQSPVRMLMPSKYNDNVFAITDGQTRALLRLPGNIIIQEENLGSRVKWRNGTRSKSILNVSEENENWVSGVPTVAEFDSVWHDTLQPISSHDVLRAIDEEGISNDEAVRRIRQND